MAGRKLVVLPFHDTNFTNKSLGADVIGTAVNVQYTDDVGISFSYSGNPVGLVNIQFSIDYSPNNPDSANWSTVLSEVIPTNASPMYFDLFGISTPWIRVTYTYLSGSGTGNAWLVAKEI